MDNFIALRLLLPIQRVAGSRVSKKRKEKKSRLVAAISNGGFQKDGCVLDLPTTAPAEASSEFPPLRSPNSSSRNASLGSVV
ncbi:hypothetical protein CEXT_346601 [Caerostris extrusa]|uniref:Uncharacterized protein n=1 Tax=Caerostris extrusa TaxID=172846 RepID=A0AAV4NZV4_CAEEX|nr:hypothetical protein CEXT_346601 [Caerostris extrusa]